MGIDDREIDRFEREEFEAFLKQLVDTGDLSKPAEGIAKLVLAEGQQALTPKQAYVFKKAVIEPYSARCSECGEQVRWSEAYEFFHGADRCGDCQVRYEKFMAD